MDGNRLRALIVPATVALVLFVGFVATRSVQQTGDALLYAWSARTGVAMLHPHHLLFAPIIRLLDQIWQAGTGESDCLLVAAIHNAAWAVTGTLALWAWTSAQAPAGWNLGPFAIPAAALFLSSRGVLQFGTQAEVYVPAAACAVLTMKAAAAPGQWSARRILGVALLYALATLYHQACVLLGGPLLLLLRRTDQRIAWSAWIAVVTIAGSVLLGAYIAAYASLGDTAGVGGFLRFCKGYVASGHAEWASWDNLTMRGAYRLFRSQLDALVQLGDKYAWWVPALCASLFATFVYGAFVGIRSARMRRPACAAALWLIVYYAFLWYYLPWEWEFFVMTTPPCTLLLVCAVTRLPRPLLWLGVVLAAFGVWCNLADTAARRRPGDEDLRAAAFAALATDRHRIVTDYSLGEHLRYTHGLSCARIEDVMSPYVEGPAARVPLPPSARIEPPAIIDLFRWKPYARISEDERKAATIGLVGDLLSGSEGRTRRHEVVDVPGGPVLVVSEELQPGVLAPAELTALVARLR